MNEQRERRVPRRVGKKQIDLLAGARPISEAKLGILFRGHALAIGRRLVRPAREDLAVLRYACAIVVLDVVVDHYLSRPLASRTVEEGWGHGKQ